MRLDPDTRLLFSILPGLSIEADTYVVRVYEVGVRLVERRLPIQRRQRYARLLLARGAVFVREEALAEAAAAYGVVA